MIIIIITWQIGGGGGCSWAFMVGACVVLHALQILTQDLISDKYLWDKCKGKLPREFSLFLLNGDKHYKLLTIKHIRLRQQLNEDVFEASTLHFFIISFKSCYDEYLLWFFLHFLLKFKPFDEFFPSKTSLQISLCV